MARFQGPVLPVRRTTQLILGLIAFGVGSGMMVNAHIGVPPWDVLTTGLTRVTLLSFGTITVLTGIVLLIVWIPLRERPGVGTVLNALMIGPVAQLTIDLVPHQEHLPVRVLMFAFGLCMLALGTGLYIGAQFGPGPRDGLMTGLHRVTVKPVWMVRTAIEVSVLIVGWAFGGDVGFGTLVFAIGVGPLAQPAMRWFDLRQRILDEMEKREQK